MLEHPASQAEMTPPRSNQTAVAPDFPVVGVGASAGGLDAFTKLIEALPATTGMALILVQHLDPTHESMMVELLTGRTSLTVRQATDGARLQREHIYTIPPGAYLSVEHGALRLSSPRARHGARLPFDFLLHSLAREFGRRAICVVLSGTGADGCLGLRSIKEAGGLVIAQEPRDARHDGMPRSAIMTGTVDLVLPAPEISAALVKHERSATLAHPETEPRLPQEEPAGLLDIIHLLRARTAHDFTLYKQGTLQRRVERRMALASIKNGDLGKYLKALLADPDELDCLATDLLINVTTFFRDPKVYALLEETIVPDLVGSRTQGQSLRIWIAGCSTGEEAYSLTMLLQEEITRTKSGVKLQVFASDADPDAIAVARDGLYPETIEANVSPARLQRFFSREDHGYRVLPELRATVVFTVQDLLSDPPFSRLDVVSCRNLLIYLGLEAQAKVISLFHFALNEGASYCSATRKRSATPLAGSR